MKNIENDQSKSWIISKVIETIEQKKSFEEINLEVIEFLSGALANPINLSVRINVNGKEFRNTGFHISDFSEKQWMNFSDQSEGFLEIFYPESYIQQSQVENHTIDLYFLNTITNLLIGHISKFKLEKLFLENKERVKELKSINLTSEILNKQLNLDKSLQMICSLLPEAWQYPEYTCARIKLESKIFVSKNFRETEWKQSQEFQTADHRNGWIEIFISRKFPDADEGPFLKEERNLLINLSSLIAGSTSSDVYSKLLNENKERIKELSAINRTTHLIAQGKAVDQTLIEIVNLLPKSWQYPKYTKAKIFFEGNEYFSYGFKDTVWNQKENFITIDNKIGYIQIVYTREFKKEFEGPFLREERNLLNSLAKLISGYLNNFKGREIIERKLYLPQKSEKTEEYKRSLISNRKPLQLFFNQQVLDKYIYLDMMKYKVKEILFVATFYDAFILENEDNFFEQFMGEIYQYSLFSRPRITAVTTPDEALELLSVKSFDLVILMVGLDKELPVILSEKIKVKAPAIPVYLLLNQKDQIKHFEELVSTTKSLDKLFVWSGDSQIIFAIVKSIEDNANLSNDTQVGLVRVILLVEDSPLYYSRYMQYLYSIVFGQVQQLLPEVEKNEIDKICKMRSRPKIIHVRNFEDAMHIFTQYKDFLLCVISDVEFEKEGKLDKSAGIKFIKYIQSHILKIPVILQSSDNKNSDIAESLQVQYLNKNSKTLFADLKQYLNSYIGFGDFIFRDKKGNEIATAKTIKEFEYYLEEIQDETFFLHAKENQLSIWLMARGEIQLAKRLNPVKINHIEDVPEARNFTLKILRDYQLQKKKGKILEFDETKDIDSKNIYTLANGSFGGKGRGLAFINTLIYNLENSNLTNKINISVPKTLIIGTDEFDSFILNNSLYSRINSKDHSYEQLKNSFLQASLSKELLTKIRKLIEHIQRPIAVRSSSLSEDSYTQPFAGVFHTYIIPNCKQDKEQVLQKIEQSIKLVFSSIYTKDAKRYFKAIHHQIEEEKMAVIIQELVGQQYEDYYYPHISGTACSYNFYPIARMQPSEGFAMAAFGLGTYVVEGMSAYRFSPKYPDLENYSTRDLLNSSQTKFYAVDCRKNNVDYATEGELASLSLLDISEAEKHNTLKHCVSVYDTQNDRISPGLKTPGPRILNFANILKYNHIPLAETLNILLNIIKDALGSAVEIEYSVDLSKAENGLPTFYLLQIKPMVESHIKTHFNLSDYKKSELLLYSKTSIGNGLISEIYDVIYIEKDRFNKLKTLEMVAEIEYLNQILVKQKKPYILIGPGRWGTRDRFLGIPVNWSQISGAKVIVETSLNNFPLDSSLGSHFFHNVTSMNIAYLSVNNTKADEFINWEILKTGSIQNQTEHFKHIKFENALTVMVDGRKKESIITHTRQK